MERKQCLTYLVSYLLNARQTCRIKQTSADHNCATVCGTGIQTQTTQ